MRFFYGNPKHPSVSRTRIIFKQIFVEIPESFEKQNGKLKIKNETPLETDLWT